MKKLILTIFLLVSVILVEAQVKTNFNNKEKIGPRGKYAKNFQDNKSILIPARDTNALLEKERRNNRNGEARPFQIAEPVYLDIDAVSQSEWVEENGVAHGKLTIQAAGAKSISANFDQFYLPTGSELFVYSENGEMITGPVTEAENNKENFWGTWVYKGQELTIEVKVAAKYKSALRLHISSVGYGYKDIYKTEVADFGESEACNINVLCDLGDGWEDERNSVALILDASSSALCSGALIENTCSLNIPYLLTANHCFDTNPQQNVAQWKFTFQAWSPTCTPSENAIGTTFNGSTLRARNAGSDFCLVELNQVPPGNSGITFSGWSRNTAGITNTTIIHHPAGDVMKISRDNQPPVFSNFGGAQCWLLGLDLGATEGGSSGSPYYDQNHRIIGQHFGINDGFLPVCDRVNKFGGRFNISWTGGGTNATRLSNWLDPGGTNAMTTDTRGIPWISGPTLVCTSNAQFTLNNVPPGATVSWAVGPPSLFASASGSGATANLSILNPTGTGNGCLIQFTITTACGSNVVQQGFEVGIPPVPDIVTFPGGNPILVQPNTTINANALDNGTISWAFEGTPANYNYALSSGNLVCNFTPTAPGTYKIKARADYGCGPSAYDIVDVTCSRPDLTIQSLSVTPSGGNISLNYNLKNIGLFAATSPVVKYYRSTNATYDGSDTYLGVSNFSTLAANGTVPSGIVNLTLAGSGSFILAYADPSNVIPELLETNNVQARMLMEEPMLRISVEENVTAKGFAVYPVPFENELHIEMAIPSATKLLEEEKNCVYKITLLDVITSKVVQQVTTSEKNYCMDTKEITAGQYLLVVEGTATESRMVLKK